MKKKSFLFNAVEKLFDDLDQYVDGTKYQSRTHLMTVILKDWIEKRKVRPLKEVKKAKR